tara:strand:- start:2933 stop:3877 length:945 start_codon:yes stop_codon:yes gene_type:complete
MAKIYLNRKSVKGPYGGGNKTLALLEQRIVEEGHKLVYELENDIDVIFCYDPRPNQNGIWYQNFINYKKINHYCKIVQRVGDTGTHSKPQLTALLKQIVKFKTTDFFIFPSKWARDMIEHSNSNYQIIPNRPLAQFYENRDDVPGRNKDVINIVTHHWSDNRKKGFEVYEKFGKKIKDGLVINDKNVKFTYIGRYSQHFTSDGISVISPVGVSDLNRMLPKYDIYLTASEEEAGANHVLEAMAAGLPILYRENGGSINEYCKDYGIKYEKFDDLIKKIQQVDSNFAYEKEKVLKYCETANNTIEEYIEIIKRML